MEEEGSHAEPGSMSVSVSGSTHTIPQLQPENTELHISPSSAPCSPTPTGTLNRLGLRSPSSTTAASPPSAPGQVSAITVVALLDKLVNMMEAVQENQQRMEQRQSDLEGAVRVVQGDVTRLSKAHLGTANSVNKLLERSRKVNGNVKEVKERLDRQAVQVKKLEANHNHLLKRNNFKVLIFQ
ncbi:Caveolae-associated protein 2, partial [Xenoophorus captivus]